MNFRRLFEIATVALVLIASGNALAQDNRSTEPGSSKSDIKKANRSLGKRVELALSKKGVGTANISVLAKGGTITLAGSVADQSQIEMASRVAQGVEGVTSVSNRLTIRAGGQ